MIERGHGKIINLASMLSFFGGFTVPAYAASKGGVAQLTKDVADRDATIASNSKQYKIKDELRGLHARNVDVIWPLLNLEKITENDGKLEGLAEQVEALKQSDAYLFDINTGSQRGGSPGAQDIGGGGTSANATMNNAIRALSGRA